MYRTCQKNAIEIEQRLRYGKRRMNLLVFLTVNQRKGLTMTAVRIDTNVKVPQAKKVIADMQRRQSIFKAYADAYEKCYVSRPTGWRVAEGGFLEIVVNPTNSVIGSEKRIKQLTNMLRSRLKA